MTSKNLVQYSDAQQPVAGSRGSLRIKLPRRSPKRLERGTLMRSAATGFFRDQAVSMVAAQAFNDDGSLTHSAETWLTRAATVQRPLVMANLRRLRKAHPSLTNQQLARELDKDFLRAMTGGGALIGATAAAPRVGTVASLGLSTAATGAFLEASAIYAQSMAELSGITTEDPEGAKALVMAVMLGDEGRSLLGELSAQADGRSTGPFASMVPLMSPVQSAGVTGVVLDQIKRRFVRRFFFRQGTSTVARALPYGIGAVVGAAAQRALAKQIVESAHLTFGELPEESPQRLVDDMHRSLERERRRADRRDRRLKKRELKELRRQQRQGQMQEQSQPVRSAASSQTVAGETADT